jgi:hypothetical protein
MNTSEAPLLTDAELKLLQALIYQGAACTSTSAALTFQDRLQSA